MITLDELRRLTPDELYRLWLAARFPFDMIPTCDCCLTAHRWSCGHEPHAELRARVLADLPLENTTTKLLAKNLDRLWALRQEFAPLYLEPVPAARP